jgi:hypothetical protein
MNVANNTAESDYLPFIYQILIINGNVLKESDFFWRNLHNLRHAN